MARIKVKKSFSFFSRRRKPKVYRVNVTHGGRRPVRRRGAVMSSIKTEFAMASAALLLPLVGLGMLAHSKLSNQVSVDVASDLNDKISETRVNIGQMITKERRHSVPPVLKEAPLPLPTEVTKPKAEIIRVYAIDKKMSAAELKKQAEKKEFEQRTEKAFNESLAMGVPQAFLRAEKITGFSANVLLTLSRYESWFGTDPDAQGSALQTKPQTQFDYFAHYGEKFVVDVRPFEPNIAHEIATVLKYFEKKYTKKTGKPYFVFKDNAYKKDHNGQYPIINGRRVTSIKDWIMSYTKDHFVTAVLTSYHLETKANSVVQRFLNNENVKALKFFREIGGARNRLIHYRGGNGTYKYITDPRYKGADIVPDVIERTGMRIKPNDNNIKTLKAIIGDYNRVYNKVAYLNGMFKSSLRANRTSLFSSKADNAKLTL